MHVRLGILAVFLSSILVQASEIVGKVVSVVGGEPLARVQAALLETGDKAITANDGTFAISDVAPGNYTLRLNGVGFRLSTFRRWKLALYGEGLNLTNHYNPRYFYTAINPNGTFSVVTGQGLPITPTAGVAFEF
jgi:hypothetical protein